MAVLTLLVLAAASSSAMSEVYVTSPSAGRILVLDSAGAVTRVLGTSGGLMEPYSIAVDSQRQLLVTDYAAGRIVSYAPDGSNASVLASNIPKPDGLSIGYGGDLFLVSRDNNQTVPRISRITTRTGEDPYASYLRQVWMVPVGSSLPAQIASIDESFRLAQTIIPTSGPYAGNLFVLSTRPGFIANLRRTGPSTFMRMTNFATSIPGEPTSMAFGAGGELLVGTSDGRILRYSTFGQRIQPDFAAGLPAGPTRMTMSRDRVLHVTVVGGSTVARFDPYGMRLADMTGATSPVAAAIADGCVSTPAGQMVTVSPAAGINVIFDTVTASGQTCVDVTALGGGVRTTPGGNTIPDFALKLFEDPGFVVYNFTTTASYLNTIAVDFFAHNPDSRVMFAHGTGQVLQDATVLVTPSDPRGRTGGFSEFVVYFDTRPVSQVVQLKLSNLQTAVAGSEGIAPDVLAGLQDILQNCSALVGSGGADAPKQEAVNCLKGLKDYIRQNGGEGIPNSIGPDGGNNVGGILISLADTLIFHLGL